ncbi:Uncharacterised protein [Mycobacteroides abscessus]|nr:Uncharacterised protein [Mycobacteroides abscessus]
MNESAPKQCPVTGTSSSRTRASGRPRRVHSRRQDTRLTLCGRTRARSSSVRPARPTASSTTSASTSVYATPNGPARSSGSGTWWYSPSVRVA